MTEQPPLRLAQPCPRRGDGTGLSVQTPVITRYSNNARTAATRRFTVEAAGGVDER